VLNADAIVSAAVCSEPKPVKCHVCDRGFKNIAALNGHMRLHGGYVRKVPEADNSLLHSLCLHFFVCHCLVCACVLYYCNVVR